MVKIVKKQLTVEDILSAWATACGTSYGNPSFCTYYRDIPDTEMVLTVSYKVGMPITVKTIRPVQSDDVRVRVLRAAEELENMFYRNGFTGEVELEIKEV